MYDITSLSDFVLILSQRNFASKLLISQTAANFVIKLTPDFPKLARSLASLYVSSLLLYLAKGTPADDFKGLEILNAEPGPLESEELGLLLGMLQPLFLLLLLREALIFKGLLELRQPLLPLDMLRYQIAVIVLQRYLQEAKRTCNALIIIVSNPHDIVIILLLSSRELDVTRSIMFYLVHNKTTSAGHARLSHSWCDYYAFRDQVCIHCRETLRCQCYFSLE